MNDCFEIRAVTLAELRSDKNGGDKDSKKGHRCAVKVNIGSKREYRCVIDSSLFDS